MTVLDDCHSAAGHARCIAGAVSERHCHGGVAE